MLQIEIPAREFFDDATQEFVETKAVTLSLEHSLISISKWESKWKKSYFDTKDKTAEEIYDYIKCMVVTPKSYDERALSAMTEEDLKRISEYINDPMTATTIHRYKEPGTKKEIMTSELIYYSMIAQNVPIEFEKWHINRLITLLEVCAIKNDTSGKKMPASQIAAHNRALNKARRAKYHTKG